MWLMKAAQSDRVRLSVTGGVTFATMKRLSRVQALSPSAAVFVVSVMPLINWR